MKVINRLLPILTIALHAFFFPATTEGKNCLWKVSSGGEVLYLQGSVHLLKPSHYPLDPAIEQAYSESSTIIMEADLAEMSSPKVQQLILRKAILSGTNTLENTLSKEVFQALQSEFTKAGIPPKAMLKFKPWFAATALSLAKIQQLGFSPKDGLDSYFSTRATADKKTIIGLETAEFQMELFSTLDGNKQDDFIRRTLADLKMLERDLNRMIDAWENGNIESLDKLTRKSFTSFPDLYRTFVTDRNHHWCKKIDPLFENEGIEMVIVGAAHLPGEEGLLTLLQKQGYQLEQL